MDIDVSVVESIAEALKVIFGVSTIVIGLLILLAWLIDIADKRRK